jgi:hypothetical protein
MLISVDLDKVVSVTNVGVDGGAAQLMISSSQPH